MSNRTSRDNLVNTAFGELYAYDDLSQLVSFQRGTLNGTKTGLTGSASRSQSWDTDAVGNFDSVTTDGSTQTRSANRQNQITSISGATTPTYDDNGNMTGDETGRQFVYDAWNRLVIVKNSSGTTLETFKYDGLNRRVSSSDGTTVTDLYYSSDWQVLSEKVASNYTNHYVWSPVYVDAMILRDRDTNADGTLDERLWVQQDANWNVTALANGSGTVVERYAYDPYGVRTVYDASYTVRSGGSSNDFQPGFQGMWYDATSGLNFTDTRPYSPTLGRFIGPDWIRFDGSDVNLYRMEGNNSVANLDPEGTQPVYGGYRPSAPAPEPPRMPPPKNPFITISISDITLTVLNRKTKQMLKPPVEINLGGKGELKQWQGGSPPRPPTGNGYDLTNNLNNIVEAEATVNMENKGTCPLMFDLALMFSYFAGKHGYSPYTESEADRKILNPGKSDTDVLNVDMPIKRLGPPIGGKYSLYTVLSVMVYQPKLGKGDDNLARFVVVTEPWSVKERDINGK